MGENERRALLVSIFVLAFATLALASAPRWAACLSAAFALLAVVPLASSRRVLAGPRPLLLFLSIPLIATLFQLLPLPAALVQAIAPARYALAEANAHAYGHSISSVMPLSQDWPATLVELAKFAGYFAFAYVCTRLCVSRRARRWLLMSVAVVGTLVALCAFGHNVLGAKILLGIYAPSESAYTQSLSPFLNPNHLAGYMAFVVPVCLGLAAQRRSPLFLSMALLCAFVALQAVSRGGVVSLSIGVVVTLLLVVRFTRSPGRPRGAAAYWAVLGVGIAFVGLVVLGASAGQELLELDIQREQDAAKLLSWRSAPQLLATSPWFGIGRGAFEFSFTRFQPTIGVTFSHIENEYLQAVLDWGIPTALLMALALGLLIRSVFRRGPMDAMAAGGIGAIAAIAVQSLVDFGLEFPGMALPVIVVFATLLDGKLVVVTDKRKRSMVFGARLGLIVAAVVISAAAASPLGARPDEDIAAAVEFDMGYGGSAKTVISAASRIAQRHPSSYLLPAKTAKVLWQRGHAAAFAAMARALFLNPKHSGVHLLAAQILSSSQQPRQAIAEYRIALEIAGPRQQILKSLEARFPSAEDLVLAAPRAPADAGRFGAALLQMKRPDAAEAFARQSLQRGIASYEIHSVAVQAALVNDNRVWAVEVGKRSNDLFQTSESLLLYVKALRAAALPLVALEALSKSPISRDSSELEVLDALCTLQLEVKDLSAATITANRLMSHLGAPAPHRRVAHLCLATVEEQRGNSHQARWHRQRAAELRQR